MKNLMFYYQKAIKNHFALGAFNFSSLEAFKAICNMAEQKCSPVIAAISESGLKYMGEEFVISAFKTAKKLCKAPVFLHLDHGKSFEICKRAVDLGFDSVMIDASHLEFDKNVELTKKVALYAQAKGIFVEGELGQLLGIEDGVTSDKNHFTDPELAKKFVERTGVDSLAVAIGTSHGAYKFSGKSELRFDLLGEIEKRLKSFPLVLHGASSVDQNLVRSINGYGGNLQKACGVDEKLTKLAILEHNIVKINIDTDLRIAFTEGVRRVLYENPQCIDQRVFVGAGQQMIEQVIAHKIENLLFSKNQA